MGNKEYSKSLIKSQSLNLNFILVIYYLKIFFKQQNLTKEDLSIAITSYVVYI